MKLQKITGLIVSIIILSVSVLAAGVVWTYLTEYGQGRIAVAVAIAAAGTMVAILAYLLVTRYCKGRGCSLGVLSLLAALLLVPALSMIYPGKVTYSRFGLTVYGAIPLPTLDITVGPHGGLWFRDKSHFVSIEEVEPLLSPEVDALVIGTGWYGAVQVDPAVEEIEGIEVHVLRTPAAFDLFNEYVSRGRTVVLIAHSTC
jgi:hypothetical protein